MYQRSFPLCPVKGSQDLVPYQNGRMQGAIPTKCSTCQYLNGGMCARAIHLTDELLHLDHGACSRSGNTDPQTINLPNVWPYEQIEVPYKCSSCPRMMADGQGGVICSENSAELGGFPRGVDWGKFKPDHPVVGVRGFKLDRATVVLEAMGNRNRAVRAFKAINPKVSTKQAMEALTQIRSKLMMAASQDEPGGPFW